MTIVIVSLSAIGIFTATITSFFLQPAQTSEELETIEDRLKRIEGKIDTLMRERDGAATAADARAR
jgi:hypothetical protein